MKKRLIAFFALALVLLSLPGSALAQTYYFQLLEQNVNVYYQEDGTASLDYVFVFANSPSASAIDYVDVGLPNTSFVDSSISADVDGVSVSDISRSGFQGEGGSGVAVGLGSRAIKPGKTGRVHVFVGVQKRVLYEGKEQGYASTQFSPTWFGSQYMYGKTQMTITFHLPPGVQPSEPRYFDAPSGWANPSAFLDEEGRVTYQWTKADADGDRQNLFGASFPLTYVPANAIVRVSAFERFLNTIGMTQEDFFGLLLCLGPLGFIILAVVASVRSSQKRQLQYLPPKIAIEGLGIKRGLTAVEAAILLEQPMDKVLTMILFSVLKKGGGRVVKEDPVQLEVTDPLPEGLRQYETLFLQAFKESPSTRKKKLREMMIELVQSVSNQMKGFSRKETAAYYQDIMKRAWAQVEEAATPDVRMEKYSEYMEWTMLDKDYDDRTREVFRRDPVIVAPTWWWRYRPSYSSGRPVITSGGAGSRPTTSTGGGISTPKLPGSDFAAAVVTSTQSFSQRVVGSVQEFTTGITQKTNPVPVSTSSSIKSSSSRSSGSGRSGGSGCACACACACAGCACACAGGGR